MHATPFIRVGAIGAVYFAAAAGCIALTRFGAQVAPIWLASPFLVWALLSAEDKRWPAVLFIGAVAHALANLVNNEPLAFAAPYLVANMAEALLAAALLRRARVDLSFVDRAEVFRFLAICGIAAPICSTALVKIGLTITGQEISDGDLVTWYLSIALGMLLFLPLLNGVKTRAWTRLWQRQPLRGVMLAGALAAACAAAICWPGNVLLLFLVFPILTLIAFDFGLKGAEAALAFTAAVLIIAVLLGYRPDLGAEGPREEITRLQILLAVLSAGILPLAATVEEKQRLYESASYAQEEAQQAWGDVIAAEANYRLLADNTRALVLRINGQGVIEGVSATSSVFGYDQAALEGLSLFSYLDEEGAAALSGALAAAKAHTDHVPEVMRLRIRGRDNSWCIFEAVMRRPPPSPTRQSGLIVILTPVN